MIEVTAHVKKCELSMEPYLLELDPTTCISNEAEEWYSLDGCLYPEDWCHHPSFQLVFEKDVLEYQWLNASIMIKTGFMMNSDYCWRTSGMAFKEVLVLMTPASPL
ncbi:uncharacterized protein BJ212DRAFT_1301131 [Suillus subaureus]|uniref:Uncharacterized protein n=1 Tax=Suillus subaureus TaxID=48587 RepID=A0A9P7E732_9AGAM|nr:uncharacterized protein BJ212DRAFT_1301131 [Suillus subaureus]KAG1813215.1 hypothetical protein BJ212DRAFT_1301131 [Suillus subaureus]